MVHSDEAAQAIYEYSRRGIVDELRDVIGKAHPDSYLGYDGSTALIMACKNGHHQVCELLIAHGADVSVRTDDGSSTLLLAACTESAELLAVMLRHCMSDLNSANEDGFTPLDMALHYKRDHMVSALVSHGALSGGVNTPDAFEVEAGPSEKWGYGVFDQ